MSEFLPASNGLGYGVALAPFALVFVLGVLVSRVGVAIVVGSYALLPEAIGVVVFAIGAIGAFAAVMGALFKLVVDALRYEHET